MQRSAARLREFGRGCSPSGSITPARPIPDHFAGSIAGALRFSNRWASTSPAKRSRTAIFFPGMNSSRVFAGVETNDHRPGRAKTRYDSPMARGISKDLQAVS